VIRKTARATKKLLIGYPHVRAGAENGKRLSAQCSGGSFVLQEPMNVPSRMEGPGLACMASHHGAALQVGL
jgi:hypothetical protein